MSNLKLGEKLKLLRKTRKLTLRDLENEVDASNAYLSQLENGKSKNPSVDLIKSLADFYNLSIDDLID